MDVLGELRCQSSLEDQQAAQHACLAVNEVRVCGLPENAILEGHCSVTHFRRGWRLFHLMVCLSARTNSSVRPAIIKAHSFLS